MQRRSFICSASLMAGVSLLPFAGPALAARPPLRWQLLWAPSAEVGTRWRPVREACSEGCSDEALIVSIDAMHAAQGGAVVTDLGVHAMFDLAEAQSARFTAWQMGGSGLLRTSTSGARFIAGRATLRRFELEYALAGPSLRETCELTGARDGLLNPGHYLLVGPRADGSAIAAGSWVHSGDPLRPLSQPVDADVLAFRVEVLA